MFEGYTKKSITNMLLNIFKPDTPTQSSGGKTYEEYAKEATKNSSYNTVVLGKYDEGGVSYVEVAKKYKVTYFQLSNWNEVQNTVGEENMWNINQQFLEQQMSQGKSFILSHNPYTANGYYGNEAQWLTNNGYRFVQEGNIWRAIR